MKEKWAPIGKIESETCNVAWFKLAEYVSRNERERALGIFKLLSLSFNDKALAFQLKGDLFLSFGENEDAIHWYLQAAQEFQKEQRIAEAVGIYEHLSTLVPTSKEYTTMLVRLYKCLGYKEKLVDKLTTLYQMWLNSNSLEKAYDVLQELILNDFSQDSIAISQQFIFHIIKSDCFDSSVTERFINLHIDRLILLDNSQYLTQFLSALEAKDNHWYEIACTFIKS